MKKVIIALLVLTPTFAFAQLGNLEGLMSSLGRLVELALPIVVALALLAFFWGLVKFIFAAGDEEAKDKGKSLMIWGLVALFVMVSVWGLVRFIGDALGVQQGDTIDVPTVPGLQSTSSIMDITEFLGKINQVILNPLIYLFFAIAFVVFVWGIFQFIASQTSDDKLSEGKRKIFWGLFGMFIMISAYGLIRLILGTFGVTDLGYPFNQNQFLTL